MKFFNFSSHLAKIKKHKKRYWSLGALCAITGIVLLTWAFTPFSDPANHALPSLVAIEGVQAQSYLASNIPSLQDTDKIFGSGKAPLKIFVYEDYTSPYSAALADTLDRIKAESGDNLALVVRPYVVNNSLFAAEAARAVDCAGEQGKWREMRALLFVKAKNLQDARADLTSYVQQIGLNNDKFQLCLTNAEKSGKIEKAATEAENYSVQGAPTIFIGDDMILGARPYDDFTDSNGDKIEGLKTVIARKLSGQ